MSHSLQELEDSCKLVDVEEQQEASTSPKGEERAALAPSVCTQESQVTKERAFIHLY